MSSRRERVVLELSDSFAPDLARATEVIRQMNAQWKLRDATWEPHDWSEWEK